MHHYENKGRYWRATLLTEGATLGVFLSNDLFTTFVFFEIMSIASYAWVAHDENEGAMRAAATYLTVAVLGGMVTLTGLFVLYTKIGTLGFNALREACSLIPVSELYLPAGLVFVGFAAKAGAFPVHIWLPKAHPVAPAPASALLSGMLTKTGIFGSIVLAVFVMNFDAAWGAFVMYIGVATMLLGAVLAVFSIDLKRTLACSSVSQIGFILTGVGLLGVNDLAGQGALLHMINHSLIKLALFMAAGAVYMKLHSLNLNDLRGYGRKKPVLLFVFLMGALGISGVPGFNGYFSKTILHEAIVEGGIAKWVEGVFLFTGGLTFAYMIKLCVVLFVDKHPTRQAEYEARRDYLSPLSKVVFVVCGALLPLAGWLNGPLSHLGESFLGYHAHEVHFFSWTCLSGGLVSLAIGAVVYFLFIRISLIRKGEYLNLWPEKLDLEIFYRTLGNALAWTGTFFARVCDELVDGFAWLMARTVLSLRKAHSLSPVGNRLTDLLGSMFDIGAKALNKTVLRRRPIHISFVSAFAAAWDETRGALRRFSRSLSFGMFLFCVGLLVTLIWVML